MGAGHTPGISAILKCTGQKKGKTFFETTEGEEYFKVGTDYLGALTPAHRNDPVGGDGEEHKDG
jgi:hypothetical protein